MKSSGGSSGAWSSKGSTSKRPFPGVQPCWVQSCREQGQSQVRAQRCALLSDSFSHLPPFTSRMPQWLDLHAHPGTPFLAFLILHLSQGPLSLIQ